MILLKWHGACHGCGCDGCKGTGKVPAGKAPKVPKVPKGCARCGDPESYGGGLCRTCRSCGNIETAKLAERYCQEIYRQLPAFARW